MSLFVFVDNVNTTLSASVTSTATTISLSSSANLPTLASGQVMPITLNDAKTGLIFEVCYVTAISGSTLTVLRGQDGTTAQSWLSGDYAYAAATAGSFNRFLQRIRKQQTISADTVLTSSDSGQSILTSGAITLTLPSATETGINGTIFGNSSGAVTVTTGMQSPGAATLSSVSGGTLAATTYYVKTTFTSAEGQETLPSAEQSIAVVADDLLTVVNASATGTVAATWSVYVGTTAGGETLQASGLTLGATWTEPTSGLSTGGNPPPTTQGGYIVLEGVANQTSVDLPLSSVSFIRLGSDGTNYRAIQPVNLGQVANVAPQTNSQVIGSPAASTVYSLSNTFTAPCDGWIVAISTYNTVTNSQSVTNTIYINGTKYGSDTTPYPMNDFGVTLVTGGTACTVTSEITTQATAPAGSFNQIVTNFFVPSP